MFFKRAVPVSADKEKIKSLLSRGVENVIPRALADKKLTSGDRLRIYLGIDPTGPKLHLGHTVPLRKLQAFCDLGHEVVFLIGSFTAMMGDPSGRDTSREPLTREIVEDNFKEYKRQAEKVLDFSKVQIRYNHEWLEKLGFREIVGLASHFTVQQLIQRDMFEKRLKENKPIALHEFLYPLMVGYDSVMLDVDCELGGSDQEFNILAGRHLQSAFKKRDKFVLTMRLIEGTDGRKMSKSYNNCIYLDDDAGTMFGKVMSIRDELVPIYFEGLTDVPELGWKQIIAGHPKDAKMALAEEIVRMYHGTDAGKKARENFVATFSKGEVPEDIVVSEFTEGEQLIDVLVASGVVSSKGDFRRLVQEGAVSIVGGEKITDVAMLAEDGVSIRVGKHRFTKLKKK